MLRLDDMKNGVFVLGYMMKLVARTHDFCFAKTFIPVRSSYVG